MAKPLFQSHLYVPSSPTPLILQMKVRFILPRSCDRCHPQARARRQPYRSTHLQSIYGNTNHGADPNFAFLCIRCLPFEMGCDRMERSCGAFLVTAAKLYRWHKTNRHQGRKRLTVRALKPAHGFGNSFLFFSS